MNDIVKKNPEMRVRVLEAEQAMLKEYGTEGLKDFPVSHQFAPGAYARTMHLPAGGRIIGKIHKHAHLNIISYGKVQVFTEEGIKELEGSNVFTSPAGVKRAVNVLKDTLWTTIHITNSTDLEDIEEEVIAKSFEEFDLFCQKTLKENNV